MPTDVEIITDLSQLVYSLQTDLEFKTYNNIENDLNFLRNMKDFLTEGDIDKVIEMIDDWIAELKTKKV